MKKLICFFVFFSTSASWAQTVVTSFSILSDITQQILPAPFKVLGLVPAGQDPHSYQMSTANFLTLSKADLIIGVGLGFDEWLASSSKKAKPEAKIYYVTKVLPGNDPHFWQGLESTSQITQALSQELAQQFPQHKKEIESRTQTFIKALKDLQAHYKTEFDKIPESSKKIVVAHDSFSYFAKEFGFQVISPLDLHMHGESSLQKINSVIQKIKKEKITGLFLEKSVSPHMMRRISESTGVPLKGELLSDNLGNTAPTNTYLGFIKNNLELILKAVKSPAP